MKKKLSAFLTAVVALTLAVIMASGCSFISGGKQGGAATPSDSQIAAQTVNFETTPKERNIEDAFVEAVAQVERTTVQIITSGGKYAGSGVIVDITFAAEGSNAAWKQDDNMIYIITCHHMVSTTGSYGIQGIGEIEVRLPDEDCSYTNADYVFYGYIGSERPSYYTSQGYAITLVGGDFESDIAILKLDLSVAAKSGNKLSKDKVQKAQIPDDDYTVSLGETVFAVGNPTGALPGSVARGIISSRQIRSVSVEDIGTMSLMQIDVATNGGSSGGGLYNLYGELIGITNAGASKDEFEGINFAIPCYLENGNGFVEIAKQLGGTATDDNYGYVSGRTVKGFDVAESSGVVYVSNVYSGSSVYGDLQREDILLSIQVNDGAITQISNTTTVKNIISQVVAGDIVRFTVSRQVVVWNSGPFARYETQQLTISAEIKSFRFCDTGYYPE